MRSTTGAGKASTMKQPDKKEGATSKKHGCTPAAKAKAKKPDLMKQPGKGGKK